MSSSSNISRALGVLIAVPASLIIAFWVMTNPTGSISGLSKLLTITIAFIALVNPKRGLIFIIPQILYTDEIKRLAVYYGAVSYSTVYEVLLGPIISILMLNAGYLAGVVFGRYSLSRNWVLATLLIGVICVAIGGTTAGSVATRAQAALNIGLYMTLIPLMAVLMNDGEEARQMLKAQIWMAIPSILWGIQQYFNGFSALEYSYARTGLSPVHSAQLLGFEKPRPFGFFGSATGYSCVGIYGALALYYILKGKKLNLLFLLVTLVYLMGIFVYKARGTTIIIPIIFFGAWCFNGRLRTLGYYAAVGSLLLSGIIFAEKLLYVGLDKINQAIATNTDWGRDVLNVSTFSDRLKGWILLGKPSTYTVFGRLFKKAEQGRIVGQNDADFHHDVITSIVLETGVVGLLLTAGTGAFLLFKTHSYLLGIQSPARRWEASMFLACGFTVSAISITTGNIFTTVPLNLAIWTAFGSFAVLCKENGALLLEEKADLVMVPAVGR